MYTLHQSIIVLTVPKKGVTKYSFFRVKKSSKVPSYCWLCEGFCMEELNVLPSTLPVCSATLFCGSPEMKIILCSGSITYPGHSWKWLVIFHWQFQTSFLGSIFLKYSVDSILHWMTITPIPLTKLIKGALRLPFQSYCILKISPAPDHISNTDYTSIIIRIQLIAEYW